MILKVRHVHVPGLLSASASGEVLKVLCFVAVLLEETFMPVMEMTNETQQEVRGFFFSPVDMTVNITN